MKVETTRRMEPLLEGGNFFEGVRWHDGHWWVSDLYSGRVLKVTTGGEAEQVATVPGQPSGLGWLPDGSLLIVSMLDRRILRLAADGSLSEHADVTPHTGGLGNDMVVDAQGRAYVSNLGFDMFGGGKPEPATIVRVDPDGTASVAADGLLFPNGMGITPDGRTLIVAETFGARLGAFDIADDGSLSNQRVWGQIGRAPSWESVATLADTDFAPDGMTIDAEGHVWVADALNGRAARVAPGGAIVDEVRAPNGGLYSCALGGEDGRTLLCCTAPGFSDVERKATTESVLYTVRVAVPAAE
ncbi:MAG: SMP-30/Gluconolaconase/LRE-like region-containing protein [Solirubrobacterales bacterium]|nr:SMP-30/Gluconolaconase/LRE-like region-containing protein [Solirubrobacterales bacterium]